MTKLRKPKTVVPEITCDEFKRRALEAAKAEDTKRDQKISARRLQLAQETYAQLKDKLPLLTHFEGVFTMCGYVFRAEVSATSVGNVNHGLISDLSYVRVYDEVSFGRFLNEVERQNAQPARKPFWPSLFGGR